MSLSKRGKEVLLVPPLNSLGFFHFLKFFAKKRRKGKKEKKKKKLLHPKKRTPKFRLSSPFIFLDNLD